jgi:hypothetical protein
MRRCLSAMSAGECWELNNEQKESTILLRISRLGIKYRNLGGLYTFWTIDGKVLTKRVSKQFLIRYLNMYSRAMYLVESLIMWE